MDKKTGNPQMQKIWSMARYMCISKFVNWKYTVRPVSSVSQPQESHLRTVFRTNVDDP
ncbi:unnamed protein product, partial [Candidula unifasciata]